MRGRANMAQTEIPVGNEVGSKHYPDDDYDARSESRYELSDTDTVTERREADRWAEGEGDAE